jgi:hypothetical protein
MFFYDIDFAKQKHCVSPQKYFPSTRSTENLRYSRIGFGYGDRNAIECKYLFITNNILAKYNFPGPGSYNLPSVFDKTRKNKVPLN